MNILPKKRWHVRTKDNIARVRRDQAAAAAEEKIRQDKLEFAESEARINFLRRQSGLPEKVTASQVSAPEKHDANSQQTKGVDLFSDYRSHVKTTNKDLEKEQKEVQEKYEKQIGYLTYLGQDTNEALKVRSWYEVAPKRSHVGNTSAAESHLKQKLAHDPLTLINGLLPPAKKDSKRGTKGKCERTLSPQPVPPTCTSASFPHKVKKRKKDKKRSKLSGSMVKKHKSSSRVSVAEECKQAERYKHEKLEILRKERLRREAAERQRSEALFASKEASVAPSAASTPAATPRIVQKYNSQFNPELAKQNVLK